MEINSFKRNVIIAPYTSLGVGGPADYLYEAKTNDELISAVLFAKEQKIPFVVLGGGTNVLVSDNGFDGLVILARNNSVEINNENIYAGAGVILGVLLSACTKVNLCGLEWSAGLPGTLGGAIYGNAGTFGKSISDLVQEVTVIEPEGEIKIYTNDQCGFGYRRSNFQLQYGIVIISVNLELKKGDPEKAKDEIKKNALWRAQHHPPYKSCGCVFRNAALTEKTHIPEDNDQPVQWFDKIPAGWLIDKAELKGKKIGGFTISDVHGNFLINDGTGTAKQLEELIAYIKEQVKDKFNVELEEEVRRIG